MVYKISDSALDPIIVFVRCDKCHTKIYSYFTGTIFSSKNPTKQSLFFLPNLSILSYNLLLIPISMKLSATYACFVAAAFLGKGVAGQAVTGITVTSDVFVFTATPVEGTFMPTETATQLPTDGTPVPIETISPSDILGTPSPSAFDSTEDTMVMDETEVLNVTGTETNATNFLDKLETDVPSSLWNQTSNVSDINIDIEADDDDDEEATMAPSVELIEVEPETVSPTQSPTAQATENMAPSEQVAVSSTSDAPKHDLYSSSLLSIALVFVSTFMLVIV